MGLALSYVFLQLIHYGVWLAWVPLADTNKAGTGARGMLVAVAEDLGRPLLWLVVLGALAIVGASFIDAHRTRQLFYLSVATFHGYLELAAGGYLLMRGSALRGYRRSLTKR